MPDMNKVNDNYKVGDNNGLRPTREVSPAWLLPSGIVVMIITSVSLAAGLAALIIMIVLKGVLEGMWAE